MDKTQSNKLYQMTPMLAFVVGYFFFHLFDWMEVTQAIGAVWVSLAAFLFLAADLKMEHKGKANFKTLNFYSGLLTLISLIILAQGIIHWNRLLPFSYRMGIFAFLLLLFFFSEFRGMAVLMKLKTVVEKKE